MKVLMVCLGNICRSPMAQGIMRHIVDQHGLDWEIDSAGTGSWHVGELPDARAIRTCANRGIDITDQRARQLKAQDFRVFDVVLAMDDSNLTNIKALAAQVSQPCHIEPIVSYAGLGNREVADPYYDGRFDDVFDLLWESCTKIVEEARSEAAS